MKNNKFVSLSDFENTLVINGFNGKMIEKAEHKVHKYLRKEGGKYIYDYDKMNAKEHDDAAWEHHVQHIVNDTKAEGRKMAKDKELEEHYRKHAAYHKEEKEKHTKLAEEKKTGKKEDALNFFEQNASQPLSFWQKKGWIYKDDPHGWFQWYCRYFLGRRIVGEDDRQIKRWKAIQRHIAQVVKNCRPHDLNCRRKQRQAILHWGYDSRKI